MSMSCKRRSIQGYWKSERDRVLRAVFLGHMVAGLVGVDATPEQVVAQLTALKSSVRGSS